jgi:hypothetical protein
MNDGLNNQASRKCTGPPCTPGSKA